MDERRKKLKDLIATKPVGNKKTPVITEKKRDTFKQLISSQSNIKAKSNAKKETTKINPKQRNQFKDLIKLQPSTFAKNKNLQKTDRLKLSTNSIPDANFNILKSKLKKRQTKKLKPRNLA